MTKPLEVKRYAIPLSPEHWRMILRVLEKGESLHPADNEIISQHIRGYFKNNFGKNYP